MNEFPIFRREGTRGYILLYAVVSMSILFPTIFMMMKYAGVVNRDASRQNQQEDAREISNTVLVDFMRQFSQDWYMDHFDSQIITRAKSTFLDAGFSTVDVVTVPEKRTLIFNAKGNFGGRSEKNLLAVVKFVSNLTRFVSANPSPAKSEFWNDRISTSDGPYWRGGSIEYTDVINNSLIRFNGGPVIIEGNLSLTGMVDGTSGVEFNCDLYYGGTAPLPAAFQYNGNIIRANPGINWPTLEVDRFIRRAGWLVTAGWETWTFGINNGVGAYSRDGGVNWTPIPSEGLIMVASGTNVTVTGQVRGRVTIVCAGTPDYNNWNPTEGAVYINTPFEYADGAVHADADHSIGVLATNRIFLDGSVGADTDKTFYGVYFVQAEKFIGSGPSDKSFGTTGPNTAGLPNRTLTLVGTKSYSGHNQNNPGGNALLNGKRWLESFSIYDPNLITYPPPGLPERPILVTWRFRSGD